MPENVSGNLVVVSAMGLYLCREFSLSMNKIGSMRVAVIVHKVEWVFSLCRWNNVAV